MLDSMQTIALRTPRRLACACQSITITLRYAVLFEFVGRRKKESLHNKRSRLYDLSSVRGRNIGQSVALLEPFP